MVEGLVLYIALPIRFATPISMNASPRRRCLHKPTSQHSKDSCYWPPNPGDVSLSKCVLQFQLFCSHKQNQDIILIKTFHLPTVSGFCLFVCFYVFLCNCVIMLKRTSSPHSIFHSCFRAVNNNESPFRSTSYFTQLRNDCFNENTSW